MTQPNASDPLREALDAFIQAPATIHDWDKVPAIVRIHYDGLRKSARAALATPPPALDAAWAAAEAALPEGWHLSLWRTMSGGALGYGIEATLDYGSGEDRDHRVEFVHAPTLNAALLALAARLTEDRR